MQQLIHTHWLGTLSRRGAELRFDRTFVLAGIEWTAPPGARIELRARLADGEWTPWLLASVQGHDSDGGVSAAHACFGEPVWTGSARELQLRSSATVEGLSVHLVSERVREQAGDGARSRDARAALARASGSDPVAAPILPAGPGQPPIVARSAWAGNRGAAAPPAYGDVRMMFVHHSVNANGYSAAEVPAMLLSIYEFHRYVRGWNDIGYNFAIDAFGRIWEAREGGIDQAVVGAQAGGYNLESSGVVMLGTFAAALPTDAALTSLQRLLAWKLSLHGVPISGTTTVEVDPTDAYWTAFKPGQRVTLPRIAGHRDGCTTDCPGADLYGHLPVVRTNVRSLVGARQLKLALGFPTSQDAAPATYLDLAVARVRAGEPVSLIGELSEQTVTGEGTGSADATVAAQAVEIQSLEGQLEAIVSGASGPLTVSTGADGRFSAVFTPVRNMLVRALKAAAPAVASPLVAIAVAPALTLTVASQAPLLLTGTITPHKAKVQLQVYNAGGAHKLVHAETLAVLADGSFHVRPTLKPGSYWARVVAAADADNVEGESARLTLTV